MDAIIQDGKIVEFGQDVKACAMGQACSAIVGKHIISLSQAELHHVAKSFETMIKEGHEPSWPDEKWSELNLFRSLHGHSSRYGSVMLPFDCLKEIFQQKNQS